MNIMKMSLVPWSFTTIYYQWSLVTTCYHHNSNAMIPTTIHAPSHGPSSAKTAPWKSPDPGGTPWPPSCWNLWRGMKQLVVSGCFSNHLIGECELVMIFRVGWMVVVVNRWDCDNQLCSVYKCWVGNCQSLNKSWLFMRFILFYHICHHQNQA